MRLVTAAFIALFAVPLHAQTKAVTGVPIFETPGFAEGEGLVSALVRAGALDRAEETLDQLIRRYPGAPRLQIAKAQLALSRDDPDKALAALATAQSLGFADIGALLVRPGFEKIAEDQRLNALLAAPPTPLSEAPFAPGPVIDGWGEVTAKNTKWEEDLARLRVSFTTPSDLANRPAFIDLKRPANKPLIELTQLVRRGKAAGNDGDIYDNRDDDHSTPRDVTGTQVIRTRYDAEARGRGLHYGLNEKLLFDGITFGNSSTALTGKSWRSQPRHALTTQFGPIRAWQLYDNNHIYVFPEHRDHDPKSELVSKNQFGKGDVFPANTPLMLVSQGSSGSDKGLLQAIQVILAAFKPEVKTLLARNRLIAPTVQQILRRGMKGIETEEDYLSPKAHPTVFDQTNVRLDRMIQHAYGMMADAVPPRVRLSLRPSERQTGPFAALLGEELFSTPDAIAHLWRGGGRTRVYSLSAKGSFDVNDRKLTYFWRVLRGDADKIDISRVAPDASEVEITIGWHDGTTSPGGLASSRVDIALFAFNGVEYSAPAMFSVAFPTHQTRLYSDDASDGRPLSITYEPTEKDIYIDPVLWPKRRWNDAYTYGDDGRLLGWTRTYKNGRRVRFTQHGLLLRKVDPKGRPATASEIKYDLKRTGARPTLIEVKTGRIFEYRYDNDQQRLGKPVLQNGG